jgi:hypothetical protein
MRVPDGDNGVPMMVTITSIAWEPEVSGVGHYKERTDAEQP